MHNRILQLLILVVFLFSGCSKEATTIQIVRHPSVRFSSDSADLVADRYFFTGPSRVVVYPSATSPGQLYNRFTLQAFGKDSRGNSLQMIIDFDSADSLNLTGVYLPIYSISKGLHQVQIFNLDVNNLAAYSLCDSVSSFIQVQKQSPSERLVTGIFQATVCNTRDTTQKIHITNGVFTDARY